MGPRRVIVKHARHLAHQLLADTLPRRWAHTVGVAAAAERLASVLAPHNADVIVAAAWLHDIGYAPAVATTGFHPLDGATYIARNAPALTETVSLIAHHSGALFEAHQRGLQLPFRFPYESDELAILNAADLSTGPDGITVEPAARLAEVLVRYPPEHPVHRAIATSSTILVAQAQMMLAALAAAKYAEPRLPPPVSVRYDLAAPGWQAQWSGEHHTVTAHIPVGPQRRRGRIDFDIRRPMPACRPDDIAPIIGDLSAARTAAAGDQLGWIQYRAFDIGTVDGHVQRGQPCNLTRWSQQETFFVSDIAELHLNKAALGQSILVQARVFETLRQVTPWTSLPLNLLSKPIDLRHDTCASCRGHLSVRKPETSDMISGKRPSSEADDQVHRPTHDNPRDKTQDRPEPR